MYTVATRKGRADSWHGGKRQHIAIFKDGYHVADIRVTPMLTEKERLDLAHKMKAAPLMFEALRALIVDDGPAGFPMVDASLDKLRAAQAALAAAGGE
jgi:hypothetical protein